MTEPDTKTIGARIQKARLSRKMTQAELAERTGIDPVYVSQVERGHRLVSIGTLCRIADALNVRAGYLLDGEVSRKEELADKEIRQLLEGWSEDQKRVVVRILRALKDL